jgi:hypothetical protein
LEKSQTRRYLETATNIAVLLAAIAVLASVAAVYLRPKSLPQLQTGLQKGETLAPVPDFNFGDSDRSLLLVMSTRCVYCDESVPFYKQLIGAQQLGNQSVRIVAVLPNSDEEVRQSMQQKQLQIAAIPSANLKTLKVAGTPTLILVDSGGRVIDFWVGKLSQDTEQQVLKIISGSRV